MIKANLLFLTTALLLLTQVTCPLVDGVEIDTVKSILLNLDISDEEAASQLNTRIKELFDKDVIGFDDLTDSITNLLTETHHQSMIPKGDQQLQELIAVLDEKAREHIEEIKQLNFAPFFQAIDQPVKDFLIHEIMKGVDLKEANLISTFQKILVNIVTTTRTNTNADTYNQFRKEATAIINKEIVSVQSFFNTSFEHAVNSALISMEAKIIQDGEQNNQIIDEYVSKFIELYKVYVGTLRKNHGDTGKGEIQNHMIAFIMNNYKKAKQSEAKGGSVVTASYTRYVISSIKGAFTYLLSGEYDNKAFAKCEVMKKIAYYLVGEQEGLFSYVALHTVMEKRRKQYGLNLEQLGQNNLDSSLAMLGLVDYIREFINTNRTTKKMLENECYVSDHEIVQLVNNIDKFLLLQVDVLNAQSIIPNLFLDMALIGEANDAQLNEFYNLFLHAKLTRLDQLKNNSIEAVLSTYVDELYRDYNSNIGSQLYPIDIANNYGILKALIIYYSNDIAIDFPTLSEQELQLFINTSLGMVDNIKNYFINLARVNNPSLDTEHDTQKVLRQFNGAHFTVDQIKQNRNHDTVLDKSTSNSSLIDI